MTTSQDNIPLNISISDQWRKSKWHEELQSSPYSTKDIRRKC